LQTGLRLGQFQRVVLGLILEQTLAFVQRFGQASAFGTFFLQLGFVLVQR